MLDIEELSELESEIRTALNENLLSVLTQLNRTGRLEEFLSMLGMDDLLQQENDYQVYKNGKIVVIGESNVKPEILLGIAKDLGFEKKRFEFHLEYNDAKKFNFKKMQWQPSYSAVLVGPMPHSGAAKENAGSVISSLEAMEGFPPVVRLGNNGLKITKSDFRTALEQMINRKQIAV